MSSKKESIKNWQLYFVTDSRVPAGKDLFTIVREACKGGVDVVQLRDKSKSPEELISLAKELLKVTREANVPLIINDHIQVALQSGADGVHLGQDDASYDEARRVLGQKAIIGRSTHSPEQASLAQEQGFDYIGIGPVYSTPTKPTYTAVGLKLVEYAKNNIQIPFVAIGGIDEANVAEVRKAGARTVAVVRALVQSPNPEKTARNLR